MRLTNSNTTNSNSFRTDINGLRAWAVIAVIFYHFSIPGFGGGFVGVDIFFVISGYLMTRIIVLGMENEKFNLWTFYLSRARRIFPALLALCVSLLVFGWFYLSSVDYNELSKHVLTSILFISNIKFWREAGYFDAASHEKWLLHTWSLSVEWQFYLLLPLILITLWKLRPNVRLLTTVIGLGLLTSLVLSVLATSWKPSAAFYLLPTRAWEMLGMV